jgi:hypothetical protein
MGRVLGRLHQVENVLEDHEVGLAACGGHQVGLGQPLLVRLVARVLEQFGMLDVQPTAGLAKAQGLSRNDAL